MASIKYDEDGLLEEPCLSCDKHYVEDIWYEWCCDEKECPYEPQESNHKCHTCKHYMNGEYDGSCDSYICKEYSDWERKDLVADGGILALLEKTYADFCNSEGSEGWMKIDGKEYSTDVGYALEGMEIFMEVFKQRLAESEG